MAGEGGPGGEEADGGGSRDGEGDGGGGVFDRELAGLDPGARWREWLCRIEAVLFASAEPVGRAALARVVGQEAAVDLLVADLAADLEGRPYEVVRVGAGWMLRTRPAYAPAIRAAAEAGAPVPADAPELRESELAVLAAIAWHQPIGRAGLRETFGREIGRDLLGRLAQHGLIAPGPREPRRGAPRTWITTERFLALFGLETLRDLPDPGEGGAGDEGADPRQAGQFD